MITNDPAFGSLVLRQCSEILLYIMTFESKQKNVLLCLLPLSSWRAPQRSGRCCERPCANALLQGEFWLNFLIVKFLLIYGQRVRFPMTLA